MSRARNNKLFFALAVFLVLAVAAYNLIGYYAYGGACWWGGRGMLHGLMGAVGAHGFDWTVLLFYLGLLMVISAVMLLYVSTGPSEKPLRLQCEACGREVAPEWHLCPYCGKSLRERPLV